MKERKAILTMVKILQDGGASFRIITPYDAQRTALENELRAAGLGWTDKCFNVDAFQGDLNLYVGQLI